MKTFSAIILMFCISETAYGQSRMTVQDFSKLQQKSPNSASRPKYVVRKLNISEKIDSALKEGKIKPIKLESGIALPPKQKAYVDSLRIIRSKLKELEVPMILESEVRRWGKNNGQ